MEWGGVEVRVGWCRSRSGGEREVSTVVYLHLCLVFCPTAMVFKLIFFSISDFDF